MEHRTKFEVRDNEIDIQGVVNNANYFIYMQHSRHKYLTEVLNIDYIEMAKQNIHLFLVGANVEFKKSLLPDDKFYVTCKLSPKGKIRFLFEQEIRLVANDVLIARGENIGVCMDGNTNKPFIPEIIQKTLKKS